MNSFFTIANKNKILYKEKMSKFVAYVFPIKDEVDFKKELNQIKKDHPNANHHCYAFKTENISKYSDDGEPSNAAGPHIMGQILSKKIFNVGIVVVRYFGGIKLGISGMIKSYREATRILLEQSDIIKIQACINYDVHFLYNQMDLVMSLLKQHSIEIIEKNLDLKCNLKIKCPKSKIKEFSKIFKKNNVDFIISQ